MQELFIANYIEICRMMPYNIRNHATFFADGGKYMKVFLKSAWGIVCIVAVSLTVLGAAAVAGNQLWYNAQTKFQDVTVELGTEQVPIEQFFTQYAKAEKAAFVTKLTAEQLAEAQDIPVTFRHGRQEETVTLHIVDTTAPTVEFLTHRSEPSGYVPVPEDFVVSVSDLSETALSFAETPQIPNDYQDLALTVVVTDAHGNAVEQACVVTYTWMHDAVTLELGEYLTPAHILLEPEKDAALLDQSQLVAINGAGVGQYTVSCTSGGHTMECTVTVVDTTAPTLELESVNIYPGGRVSLEDFIVTAEDLSGDVELTLLTELQRSTLGSYAVQIEAKDTYGNTVVGETTLNVVKDTTPPYIDGLGTLTVEKHSTPDYLKGVSAYDSKDGSCQVTVSTENVDLTKAGTYYAIYSSVDKSGNKASYKRKIVVNHDAEDTAALVASIAQKIGSDPEKLRDYVRNEITYTSSWGGDDPVWYGFTQWVGNCYVHNLCLRALLSYYGYETNLIWVTDKTHYWLQINLGGTWYHIDGTPGNTHTIYSLMNDEQRLATLRGRKWDTSKWPACG